MRKYNFFKQDAVRPTEEQQLQFLCPQCGKPLLPHRYNGSPLSGTVHLEATCPHCGWDGHVATSGWRIRSQALRETLKADKLRMLKAFLQ